MIKLAEEFFGVKNAPEQIAVNEQVVNKLKKIHPDTMVEKRNQDGPIAWVLVIPTSHDLMKKFISKKITERQLLEETPLQAAYDSLYLCSALVLPEYRGKGVATRLLAKAVRSIRKQFPIQSLFFWAFSAKGERLASHIAQELGLSLYRRSSRTRR